MVTWFELAINVLEMFIVLLFLTLYFGSKYSVFKASGGFVVGLTVTVGAITYLNSIYIYEAFFSLIFMLLYFIYSWIFLKGDMRTKLFMSGFINCIVYFCALVSILSVSVMSGQHGSRIFQMTPERVLVIAMSKIMLIVSCIILLKFKLGDLYKRKSFIVIILLPIVTDLSMVGFMQLFLNHNELKSELLLASVSVMLANILTYYICIRIKKDIARETEINIIQQKYDNDRKHAQDIEELYAKTCGIRHDLLIHFTTLSELIKEDAQKAQEYIQTVTHNQIEEIKSFVKTDNHCFDAIINAKIALCERLDIKVQTRVMLNTLSYLKHDEIAIIFGNLFDNAIEAAKKSKKKTIELDIQEQGEYVSILMINSIDKSVLKENENLQSTKKDKEYHGFGTKNIKRIAERYKGMVNYYEENNCFCCDILMLKKID